MSTTSEATPTEVELTPTWFRRRTRDVTGRVLVRRRGDGPAREETTTVALHGRWAGDVELSCRGTLSSARPGDVAVYGAGVDPTNTSFKGALLTVLSEGERPVGEGLDMSRSSLEGRFDFAVRVDLPLSAETPPRSLYRVFLRDNALQNASLRLEDLHGVLERRNELLESPRIVASLAGHPLELRDVLVLRLGEAAGLAEADPLLRRPNFWHDPEGLALQADLFTEDLPLDREHLSSLLEPETLRLLGESTAWHGAIDVPGARVVVTTEEGGGGRVAVRGTVEPHDLSMHFGFPLLVPQARVAIEELVFEAGRVRGWGRIGDLEASVVGRRLGDAQMLVTYVDGRLSIENLAGDFEGGRLESLGGIGQGTRKALAFDLAPPYRFDLALRMDGVRAGSLLKDVFESSVSDRGRIDGGLRLSGTPEHVLDIAGSGWLRLEEGRLWSIPVMRELFLTLGFDNTAVFDRMRAHFEVADGRITTSDVKVRSNILNLVGAGWIDFDGQLHYDLEARYGLIDRLGPLTRLLYWLNNSLWRVAVRGDMERPRVHIRNSLLEFLRSFDEDPPRRLPLPDFTPLPARF